MTQATHELIDGNLVELSAERQAEIAASEAAAAAEAPRLAKLAEIARIEATITPRRMREAALTEGGRVWLAARDAEIAALRGQL